jgi:two-component system, cell cycle response regulator
VARVLVVDDSSSIRSLLASRLRESGFEVDEAPDGETGCERAVARPPDIVVTDLVMKGLSGVQLCRILRSDPATAHIPIVLLTASGDKRSRFWARSAGAAAYLFKDRIDDLVGLLPTLLSQAGPPPSGPTERVPSPRRTLHERMSAILDTALFDSVIAGEVRALASCGSLSRIFGGLVTLVSDVLSYRWFAVESAAPGSPVLVHVHSAEAERVDAMVRSSLGIHPSRPIEIVSDDRAVAGEGLPVETRQVVFAGESIGRIALAPTSRGLSREEGRILGLVANELGGSLQMGILYEDAQRLAATDALTSMPNRRAFLDAIETERLRSERHSFPLSVLLLDVDHFKAVNDSRGHAAGDAVLRGIARVLFTVARRTDIVARWGGEEFVIALPQTREAGARVAAERVRRAIEEAKHTLPGGEIIGVTASVGVSSADAPWQPDALIASADSAMYAAKARGRNRVEVLGTTPTAGSSRRMKAAAPK